MKRLVVSSLVLVMVLVSFSAFASQAVSKPGTSKNVLEGQLNINTATEVELQMLPGIGKKKAQEIVAYRKAHGEFKNVSDLDKVKGIGKKKVNVLKPFCMLEGKSTLKVVK